MTKKKNQTKILLSFVGSNDAGRLLENVNSDGAIITALKNESFDEVILLWNENKFSPPTYEEVVKYLTKEIKYLKLTKKISNYKMDIPDVTNHNQIYKLLKEFVDKLEKNENYFYTASTTSGTPAMQVCWILLGESGEFSEKFPLRLIQVKDPKFGKSKNINVELGTSLPKITGLKKEIKNLKKDLAPKATVNIKRGELKIGDKIIKLSPIEFCYYRYFAERVVNSLGDEKFSGITVPLSFMKTIYNFHEESFEDSELSRLELGKMIKNKLELGITTFRGNVSKANKKIKTTLNNESLSNLFSISVEGGRGAKFYGIKADAEKIAIIKEGK